MSELRPRWPLCPVTNQKVSQLLKRTDASTSPGNSSGRLCNPDRTDALVGDVSEADNARIKTGVIITDIILKVNNIKLFGLKEFQATLTASDKGKALLVWFAAAKQISSSP